jgi:hypothetical protein
MEWKTTVQSWQGEIFIPVSACKLPLGPTWHLIQWVPEAISPEAERPGCDADHSPQSSAKVENELRTIPSFSLSTSMACTMFYYKVANIPLILELQLYNLLNF